MNSEIPGLGSAQMMASSTTMQNNQNSMSSVGTPSEKSKEHRHRHRHREGDEKSEGKHKHLHLHRHRDRDEPHHQRRASEHLREVRSRSPVPKSNPEVERLQQAAEHGVRHPLPEMIVSDDEVDANVPVMGRKHRLRHKYLTELEFSELSRELHEALHNTGEQNRVEQIAWVIAKAIVVLDKKKKPEDQFCSVCNQIASIFEKFSGEDLTQLKLNVDLVLRTSVLDLKRFIFEIGHSHPQFRQLGLAQRILTHFAKNAVTMRRNGSRFDGYFVVLTDVDNTCFPGGLWSGADSTYLRGVRYPGLQAFHDGLTGPELPVVCLTARMQGSGTSTIDQLQASGVVSPDRPFWLLYGHKQDVFTAGLGSVSSVYRQFAGRVNMEHKSWYHGFATTKFWNYVQFSRVYPELDMVFVGDAGQGDMEAGSRMLKLGTWLATDPLEVTRAEQYEQRLWQSATGEDALPNPIRAVFIKEVVRYKLATTGRTVQVFAEMAKRKALQAENIVIFDNYVDACWAAVENKLVLPERMRSAAMVAKKNMDDDARRFPELKLTVEEYRTQIAASGDLITAWEKLQEQHPQAAAQAVATATEQLSEDKTAEASKAATMEVGRQIAAEHPEIAAAAATQPDIAVLTEEKTAASSPSVKMAAHSEVEARHPERAVADPAANPAELQQKTQEVQHEQMRTDLFQAS